MRALQSAGVPAGLVHSNRGVLEDPQLEHRGHIVYYQQADIGRHPVQRSEFRLSRAPAAQNWPTPVIGQHTMQVCRDILGMADDEIEPLIAEGALEVPSPAQGPGR
jgi:benzylsuccinate CoA-transferase BbsF subunit